MPANGRWDLTLSLKGKLTYKHIVMLSFRKLEIELFHAEGQTDRHTELIYVFPPQFFERV